MAWAGVGAAEVVRRGQILDIISRWSPEDQLTGWMWSEGEKEEVSQAGACDPLLQCLYLDKCLLEQQNTNKL